LSHPIVYKVNIRYSALAFIPIDRTEGSLSILTSRCVWKNRGDR